MKVDKRIGIKTVTKKTAVNIVVIRSQNISKLFANVREMERARIRNWTEAYKTLPRILLQWIVRNRRQQNQKLAPVTS